jgi:hypothetical protein
MEISLLELDAEIAQNEESCLAAASTLRSSYGEIFLEDVKKFLKKGHENAKEELLVLRKNREIFIQKYTELGIGEDKKQKEIFEKKAGKIIQHVREKCRRTTAAFSSHLDTFGRIHAQTAAMNTRLADQMQKETTENEKGTVETFFHSGDENLDALGVPDSLDEVLLSTENPNDSKSAAKAGLIAITNPHSAAARKADLDEQTKKIMENAKARENTEKPMKKKSKWKFWKK